jgi:DNA-binding response OmpR family regulator
MSRILIVEDDDDIRELLVLVLSERGHEVVGAENGRVALVQAEDFRPNIILLDLRMPEMDGRAFAAAYHVRPGPHARLLMMTAARDAASSAAEVGADALVPKPFDLNEMITRVEALS